MDDGKIIDLEEIRRVRKQTEDNIEEQENEILMAPVRLAVLGKDQIQFMISGKTFILTETVARSWVDSLRGAVRTSRDMGEPICVTCERHACRRVHPGQTWKRKSDGKMITVEAVFGARIQVLHESGRITTITGQHKLKKRYLGPWDWPRCNYTKWQ